MKKWLFILLISFFIFMPKDVSAETFQGVHYYYGSDPSFSGALSTTGTGVYDVANINFTSNLNLPYNNLVTYRILIPCSGTISYMTPSSYIGSNIVYRDLKEFSFQYYIVGNNGSLWIPGTYENGYLEFIVPGGTQLHSLRIRYRSPGNLDSNMFPTYSLYLNSGITYYKLDSQQDLINKFQEQIEINNQQKEEQAETNEKLDDLKDSITDSDTSEASDSAGGFFTDFENYDYGLSDIVTLPLTFIQGLANASCTDLELPLPFVDEDVELPCMSAIYEDYFGAFLTIYQIITFGIVGYWVCVNTLRLVNNFKNPDNDEVEVMDL